jgi:hypothetical protein
LEKLSLRVRKIKPNKSLANNRNGIIRSNLVLREGTKLRKNFTFNQIIGSLRKAIQSFPDKTDREEFDLLHRRCRIRCFFHFFTQRPSFLANQKAMKETNGKSNAQTLFQIKQIPSDNHI